MGSILRDRLLIHLLCLVYAFSIANAQASCIGATGTVTKTWSIGTTSTTVPTSTVTYIGSAATTSAATVVARGLTVNGKWAADAIHLKKCQQLELKLTNGLAQEPVTLHFHGILMKEGQVVMDGPEGLTQRSICSAYLATGC